MPRRSFHNYTVYFLSNKKDGVLYIGVTGGIEGRLRRHRLGDGSTFTKKYQAHKLVYFEDFQYVNDAIAREKQLKNWHRQWKINLIEAENPEWNDLSPERETS
ncbi:GIY-YIG nuclease family protein [Nonlabens marinus]|uniref:Excinuclease ABC, C subunit-like n=1 Tax=Nonlabens marinus S1-08 TaxID=1454201 RepID=W8VQL0_9FLAO|nr:GIY-YIG nuclease family protein [Nonlabens marinus]BAO55724.1 excinuclease ABC, C subunit-like [Nonlabens marinus S1-08]